MGLSGMFSAVTMATGWRPGPVKLSNPSESRSSGGGGCWNRETVPELTKDLPRDHSPLLPPSTVPSSLGRASGSRVCFHFSDGNAPRAARRPNLVGAISAKPIQTAGQSHIVAAKLQNMFAHSPKQRRTHQRSLTLQSDFKAASQRDTFVAAPVA